ncbi:MAG: phosphopantetheine-binding protein [Spirosomataceae bacterium]|jgi:acyl carrier protein
MASNTLKEELKKHIIEQLNLEEVRVEDIEDDAPLFGEGGVGLDSIDALELIVLLEKYYQLNVTNPEEGKQVFYSIETMADYIEKHKS